MVGGEYLFLGVLIVDVVAFVFAADFAAVMAFIALSAVLVTEANGILPGAPDSSPTGAWSEQQRQEEQEQPAAVSVEQRVHE